MNDILRAAQDRLEALYAQAEAARTLAECRVARSPSNRRRLNHVWSVWFGRWGLSVVLHQG